MEQGKHTTVILPSDKISRGVLKDKIDIRIKEIHSRDSVGWPSVDAAEVRGLRYVLSLLNEMR